MTREQLKNSIAKNLGDGGFSVDEIRVQRDTLGGWRLAVVSKDFRDRSIEERHKATLRGVDVQIEWIDLLTPEEREWAGTLPADLDIEELPLWPEALAAAAEEPLTFPSDLDEDIPLPIRVTFYSLRGGVGRSTALAYTARLLASRGRKVVCVDMDLEAPGLAALFGKEAEVLPDRGTASLLASLDQGDTPDLSHHLIRVSDSDHLYCLPAGRPTAEYARLLGQLDPSAWYREDQNPLRNLVDALETKLPFKPDVILLDARTGISPLSAPLLFDVADLAMIVFFPHPQAQTGTAALVRALLASHTRRVLGDKRLTPEPRFIVSPVPASKIPEVVAKYRHRALEWIGNWTSTANGSLLSDGALESDITHFVPYRESIATADLVALSDESLRDFGPVAEWIERYLPTRGEQRASQGVQEGKIRILHELRFSSGTAEEQEDILTTFVETDVVKDALSVETPVVLGRKGTGKTAIFRRLTEGQPRATVVVQAPARLVGGRRWILGPDGFREADLAIIRHHSSWRQFWAYYTHLALVQSGRSLSLPADSSDSIRDVLLASVQTELDVVQQFESLLQLPNSFLVLNNQLDLQDREGEPAILLFDGLDTGFGIGDEDRVRRSRSIEGLFAFWTDRGERFRNLRFKILLREDIWRGLAFENKSHLFGRTVTLKWEDQAAFFKVVMKHAARSPSFMGQLASSIPGHGRPTTEIDFWSDAEVFAAWNLLVGERMKGGKTTFTRNWVWNRLADGNEDHSPRYLLQLFSEATEWEKSEQRRAPYDRSIIRSRALIESLPDVSDRALDALSREEFPELVDLLDSLRQIGRTPVPSDLLEDTKGVDLALEVGLLGKYEISVDNVLRYKVPEIYRHGLSMTRKGQA